MNNSFKYIKDIEVKKSMNCKVIDLPIYKCKIKMIFGRNAKKLEKDWKKKYDGYGAITRNYLDSGEILISFFHSKPNISDVVHEFHHATDMIMENIGHKKDTESDEPSAYLIGYLISEYLKIKNEKESNKSKKAKTTKSKKSTKKHLGRMQKNNKN